MMKARTLFFFLSVLAFSPGRAQTDSVFRPLSFVPGDFSYFNVDNLEDIYLITATNQLKKLSPSGDSIAVFNEVKKYGNPAFIDVTNPLKILIYYKSFSTVVILDRLLITRNTINFRKQNIFTVQALATSYDNMIWLFDEQDYKLKKIDESGTVLQQTNDLRNILDSVPSPTRLIDRDNYVYLYDPEKGFYVFDYYGSYKNRLSFTGWSDVEVSGKNIYGFSNNTLYSYELNSLTLKAYPLPAVFKGYLAIKALNSKLYILKEDGIHIYQIK